MISEIILKDVATYKDEKLTSKKRVENKLKLYFYT